MRACIVVVALWATVSDSLHVAFRKNAPCEKLPTDYNEWQNGHLWGMVIDGKDAQKGPSVYEKADGQDHDFLKQMVSAISLVTSTNIDGPPTIEMLEEWRRTFFHSSQEREQLYTKVNSGRGIVPECTNKMTCKDVNSLLDHMPTYLYHVGKNKGDCPRDITSGCGDFKHKEMDPKCRPRKPEYLKKLLENYTVTSSDSDEKKIEQLVTLVRAYAWLHPFGGGGNGRTKNLLIQREVRRLGLGCGAMMYNNNKDAMIDGFERYSRKLQEGIRAFNEAEKGSKNPWMDPATHRRHKEEFPMLGNLQKCFAQENFQSGGSLE